MLGVMMRESGDIGPMVTSTCQNQNVFPQTTNSSTSKNIEVASSSMCNGEGERNGDCEDAIASGCVDIGSEDPPSSENDYDDKNITNSLSKPPESSSNIHTDEITKEEISNNNVSDLEAVKETSGIAVEGEEKLDEEMTLLQEIFPDKSIAELKALHEERLKRASIKESQQHQSQSQIQDVKPVSNFVRGTNSNTFSNTKSEENKQGQGTVESLEIVLQSNLGKRVLLRQAQINQHQSEQGIQPRPSASTSVIQKVELPFHFLRVPSHVAVPLPNPRTGRTEWKRIQQLEERVLQRVNKAEEHGGPTGAGFGSGGREEGQPVYASFDPFAPTPTPPQATSTLSPSSDNSSSGRRTFVNTTKVIHRRHACVGLGMTIHEGMDGCIYVHSLTNLDGSKVYKKNFQQQKRLQQKEKGAIMPGPAQEAGVCPGDRVLGINGVAFLNLDNGVEARAKTSSGSCGSNHTEFLRRAVDAIVNAPAPVVVHLRRHRQGDTSGTNADVFHKDVRAKHVFPQHVQQQQTADDLLLLPPLGTTTHMARTKTGTTLSSLAPTMAVMPQHVLNAKRTTAAIKAKTPEDIIRDHMTPMEDLLSLPTTSSSMDGGVLGMGMEDPFAPRLLPDTDGEESDDEDFSDFVGAADQQKQQQKQTQKPPQSQTNSKNTPKITGGEPSRKESAEDGEDAIHPFAKVLKDKGLLRSHQEATTLTKQLQQYTNRARQWESMSCLRLDPTSGETRPYVDTKDLPPSHASAALPFEYAPRARHLKPFTPSTPPVSLSMARKSIIKSPSRRRLLMRESSIGSVGSGNMSVGGGGGGSLTSGLSQLHHEDSDEEEGFGLLTSGTGPGSPQSSVGSSENGMSASGGGLMGRRILPSLSQNTSKPRRPFMGGRGTRYPGRGKAGFSSSGASGGSLPSTSTSSVSPAPAPELYVPLTGVRKALNVRILNTFTDGDRTAYTLWAYDVERGHEWYAPVRYYRDFKDLRTSTIRIDATISQISFPPMGWGVWGGDANETPAAKESRRLQLEGFVRELCGMVYVKTKIHPRVAEIAVHLQSFLGCDAAGENNNRADGGSTTLQDGNSVVSLENDVLSQTIQDIESEESMQKYHAEGTRLLLKRSIQRYVYRLFLLPVMERIATQFVKHALSIAPTAQQLLEKNRDAKKKTLLKEDAMRELEKCRDFLDQLQQVMMDGCYDDFVAISERRDFACLGFGRLNLSSAGKSNEGNKVESEKEKQALDGVTAQRNALFHEGLREQLEIEIYVPLRSVLSRQLVNGWRHDDLEMQFKLQRPQSSFKIPPSCRSPTEWRSVSNILHEGVGRSTLPCGKLRAIVAAAKEVVRLHDMEHGVRADGEDAIPSFLSPNSSAKSASSSLGADDFLPIFIFCVVRAELERPCALGVLLSTLCDPSRRIGETGYYLASFEAAIEHIKELDLAENSSS